MRLLALTRMQIESRRKFSKLLDYKRWGNLHLVGESGTLSICSHVPFQPLGVPSRTSAGK